MSKIFLLSPASTSGKRAKMLLNPAAKFELAQKLRDSAITIGETFSFLSGLYFRGKIAYAEKFAEPPKHIRGAYVITSNYGLLASDTIIGVKDLVEFSKVDISLSNEKYLMPLRRDLANLLLNVDCNVILLGSVATGKYVEPLLEYIGEHLFFPEEFKGRGDMSRGSLMLNSVKSSKELRYQKLFPFGIHKRNLKALRLEKTTLT